MRFIPVAYQDDLSGRKLVVQIKDTSEYVILIPTKYALEPTWRGDWILDAAVSRHGFTLFEEPQAEIEQTDIQIEK